jgi:hypothetical protein
VSAAPSAAEPQPDPDPEPDPEPEPTGPKPFTIPGNTCPICGTPTAHGFCSQSCAATYRDLDADTKYQLTDPDTTLRQLRASTYSAQEELDAAAPHGATAVYEVLIRQWGTQHYVGKRRQQYREEAWKAALDIVAHHQARTETQEAA